MRKTIIAIIILFAIGGGAYLYVASGAGGGGNFAAAVPANTLVYATGSSKKQFAELQKFSAEQTINGNMKHLRKAGAKFGEAGRFLAGVYRRYSNLIAKGKPIPGAGSEPRFTFYMIGVVPVLRVNVTDAKAFKQFLNKAAALGDAHAKQGTFKKVQYRAYAIKVDKKPKRSTLLVAVRPHYAVFTFDIPKFEKATLPLALGLAKPAKSLAQSHLLDGIVGKNGFSRDDISFINHKAIVGALTGAAGSLAAKMVAELDTQHKLADLRTPGCQADMEAIAKVWPMTVIGVQSVKNSNGSVVARERVVSELTDSSIVDQLVKLRGHIPEGLVKGSKKPMASLALGVNLSKLGPVLASLQKRFLEANFRCQWLVNAQQKIKENNPAAKSVLAAMLAGVKGISLSVFDYSPKQGGHGVASGLDALVAISTKNPKNLVQLVKNAKPKMFAGLNVPSDGSAAPVFPAKPGLVKVMIAGKHLVLFKGQQAGKAARDLKNDALSANGIMFFRVDYGEVAPLFAHFAARRAKKKGKSNPADIKKMKKSMERLRQLNLRFNSLLDFDKQGVTVDLKAWAAQHPGRS
jgi:hypothetical protein